MANFIKVYNSINHTEWQKQLSNEEVHQIKGYIKGQKAVWLIPALFKPVRTNNLKNFATDLFLPTTLNHALQIENIAGRIFAILAFLVLDVLTLPLRLLTCIPRIISNAKQENLLLKYLIQEDVDKKLLEHDHVRVEMKWEQSIQETDKQGIEQLTEEKYCFDKNVNFIEVPYHNDEDFFNCTPNLMFTDL